MKCPDPPHLVAASAGQDVAALAHAAGCPRCRPAMRDELAMRDLARELPVERLDRARRSGLQAAILAHADDIVVDPPRSRVRHVAIATALVAAAAAITLAIVRDGRPTAASPAIVEIDEGIDDGIGDGDGVVVGDGVADGGGEHIVEKIEPKRSPRASTPRRIALRDGVVAFDTAVVGAPIALIGSNGVEIRAADARLETSSKAGAVVQVQVFAGSAVVRTARDSIVITAGETWTAPTPEQASSGAAAFRDGWAALRAGHHARAAALLADAARDPTFAEDARFWSAIASDRAGDAERAIAQLVSFVADFPRSPRIGEAHLTLARLHADRDPAAAARHRAAAAGDRDPKVRQAAEEP